MFTGISWLFNLQTHQPDSQKLWITCMQHLWFHQTVDPRQYQHILTLCWCVWQKLMRITIGTYLEGMFFKSLGFVVSKSSNLDYTTWILGLHVAQLRVIFALPEHLRHPHLPNRLTYIDWFTPFRTPHSNSSIFSVSRSERNHGPISEIIPLDSIVSSCHLIPRFGTKYLPAKWDSDSVLEQCKSFFFK